MNIQTNSNKNVFQNTVLQTFRNIKQAEFSPLSLQSTKRNSAAPCFTAISMCVMRRTSLFRTVQPISGLSFTSFKGGSTCTTANENKTFNQQIKITFPSMKVYNPPPPPPQAIPEFVYSLKKIWRHLALHYLLTNGSSVVNGCRQNESKQLIKTSQ